MNFNEAFRNFTTSEAKASFWGGAEWISTIVVQRQIMSAYSQRQEAYQYSIVKSIDGNNDTRNQIEEGFVL